jgi:hypothetical protein
MIYSSNIIRIHMEVVVDMIFGADMDFFLRGNDSMLT